jgi:hypothetical protein
LMILIKMVRKMKINILLMIMMIIFIKMVWKGKINILFMLMLVIFIKKVRERKINILLMVMLVILKKMVRWIIWKKKRSNMRLFLMIYKVNNKKIFN